MESITGVAAHFQAPILERIEGYCKEKGYPKLTAILVNQKDHIPGSFYPGYVGTSMHPDDPQYRAPTVGAYADLLEAQSHVFAFDWLGCLEHKRPSESIFSR
jgi:hypothetical protein